MYTYLIEEEGGLRVEADDSGEVLVVCQESHQQTEEHCTNLLVLGGESKGREGEGRGIGGGGNEAIPVLRLFKMSQCMLYSTNPPLK